MSVFLHFFRPILIFKLFVPVDTPIYIGVLTRLPVDTNPSRYWCSYIICSVQYSYGCRVYLYSGSSRYPFDIGVVTYFSVDTPLDVSILTLRSILIPIFFVPVDTPSVLVY